MRGVQPRATEGRKWFTEYHTYAELKAWYAELAAAQPGLVTFVPSVGVSVEGRDIFAVRITSPQGGPSKPQIFFQGQMCVPAPARG